MNSIKRDYFGNRKESKCYHELHLEFVKSMLSFVIASNAHTLESNKKANDKSYGNGNN